jgi:hypothetical protein
MFGWEYIFSALVQLRACSLVSYKPGEVICVFPNYMPSYVQSILAVIGYVSHFYLQKFVFNIYHIKQLCQRLTCSSYKSVSNTIVAKLFNLISFLIIPNCSLYKYCRPPTCVFIFISLHFTSVKNIVYNVSLNIKPQYLLVWTVIIFMKTKLLVTLSWWLDCFSFRTVFQCSVLKCTSGYFHGIFIWLSINLLVSSCTLPSRNVQLVKSWTQSLHSGSLPCHCIFHVKAFIKCSALSPSPYPIHLPRAHLVVALRLHLTKSKFNTKFTIFQTAYHLASFLYKRWHSSFHHEHIYVCLILVPRALLTRGATRGSGQIHNRIPWKHGKKTW